jgi:ribosomal protein S18 acetylase RimI-like enzyme
MDFCFVVRESRLCDAPLIAQVHVASWRETYHGLLPENVIAANTVEKRTALWTAILQRPPGKYHTITAWAGDAVCGFAAAGPPLSPELPHPLELYAIYVLKAAQRRGVGPQLWAEIIGRMTAAKVPSFGLWVLRDNSIARRFYENRGGIVELERSVEEAGCTMVEIGYGFPGPL